MPKFKVLLARFPYGGSEAMESVDWMIDLAVHIERDKRFELLRGRLADTPITMTRNDMVNQALAAGVDLMLMIDSDMAPDCELGEDPLAKPFWTTSVEFVLNHHGPCVVGAPYCGPPPHENVYVFEWQNFETDQPNVSIKLGQIPREKAAVLGGIQEVAALPTGLILFDMRGFRQVPPPWFSYEYEGDGPPCPTCKVPKPGLQAKKSSTEDVVLTRDLSIGGVKQYCNWDAWAGHVKRKVVRKPRLYTTDFVAEKLREAVSRGHERGDRLIDIKGGRFQADIDRALAEQDAVTAPAPGVQEPPPPAVKRELISEDRARDLLRQLQTATSEKELIMRLQYLAAGDIQPLTVHDLHPRV